MDQQKVSKERNGTTWRCPHCKAPIKEKDEICWGCGAQFEDVDVSKTSEETIAVKTEEKKAPVISTIPFDFTGKVGEYFKIWIVNVFLTILTLGVYSAWAKVRKKRYFYGNTLLQNAPFDYHAAPIKILKGRFIVFGYFVIYTLVTSYVPETSVLFGLLILLLFPWVAVKALSFKTRNSSYRNIRFDFRATYGNAAAVFIGVAILAGVTFGVAYPYFAFRRSQFVVDYSGYGRTPFVFSGQAKSFFLIYLVAAVFAFIGGVLFAVIVPQFMFSQIAAQPPDGPTMDMAVKAMLIPLAIGLLVYLPVFVYVKTAITNLVWSNTSLGDHRFESTLRTSRMIWLYLSNAVAIVISLGLLIPWASIRMARYKLDNLKLLAAGELDGFIAAEEEKVGAVGEEISDFFDFDVGI